MNADVFIIEDNESMQTCLKQIIGRSSICFSNVIDAIKALDKHAPKLIFLDVLLDGPDAFTLLNEIASYSDLSSIPIILMSNLPLEGQDFSSYGVVAFLDKTKMTPKEIRAYVERYCD